MLNALRLAALALAILVLASATAVHAASAQQTFISPERAGEALAAAWRSGSKAAILKIFGPAGAELVSSGDEVADKKAKARHASAYDAQHRIESRGEGKAMLVIGKNEFPFPIPLVKESGAWRFDTEAGKEEVLDRRIGRNELNAIEVCRAYVEAQREYAARAQLGNGLYEYAPKFASAEGKRDGLYWPANKDEEASPFGPLVARAAVEGYSAASADILAPYHGYYYKILTQQGADVPGGATDYIVDGHLTRGFALVAFPAEYGNSGIMTFIVNQDGIVFEKNLGPDTEKIAREMSEYNPDRSWRAP